MIQILKQRYLHDDKKNKSEKKMFQPKTKINAPSVQELFINIDKYIEKIPENERWNLHYTLCNCTSDTATRDFKSQSIIPFDIDSIDVDQIESYLPLVFDAIGLNPQDCGVVYSGRGIHFLIGTDTPIESPSYFKNTRKYYNFICDKIDRRIKQAGLPGHADRGLWSAGHTLRLPGTKNIKTPETGHAKENFEGDCVVHKRVINDIPDLTIEKLANTGTELVPSHGVNIETKHVGGKYVTDDQGILEGCDFIKWADKNPDLVSEPQWTAMLSIVSRLKNGRKISHKISEGYSNYNFEETEEKIDHALLNLKPYTCQTIGTMWDGCQKCPFYGKCTSPITIKSANFISTEDTGFREMKMKKVGENPDGSPQYIQEPGKIIYEDLRKYFEREHQYVCTEAKMVFVYNGKHYKYYPDVYIHGFCQEHVNPAPSHANCSEFAKLVERTNLVENDFFESTTFRKQNLANGVLDYETLELLPHSPDFGFLSCADYDYNPNADCPRFDKFMDEIMQGDQALVKILLEFAGYAFSNEDCIHDKCLILLGEGQNGKSKFIEILKYMAGRNATCALTLVDLSNSNNRAEIQGKLLNVSEETPNKSFTDSSVFKNIVTGGEVQAEKKYKDPFFFEPRMKMILAANEMPRSFDTTHGFVRRLLIVPFDAKFTGKNRDKRIVSKLKKECSGILNRIIEGYKRLTDQDEFSESNIITSKVKEFRDANDPVAGFVNEEIQVGEYNDQDGEYFIHIYNGYRTYAMEAGAKPLPRVSFSKFFARYIPDYSVRKKLKGSHRATYIKGVKLVSQDESVSADF